MKTAEEILLSKFPLLPKYSNKEGMDLIISAMEEYAKLYHESKVKELNIPAVMVELACPRCGSTNTAPSDKENDAGCYECGFVWQDN